MRKLLLPLMLLLSTVSCVKIPVQSIDLVHSIELEGERMHKLNVSMIEVIFSERKNTINEFIEKEYAPKFIQTMLEKSQKSTLTRDDTQEIMKSALPEINTRRDQLFYNLEKNKNKLLLSLNNDYTVFKDVCKSLRELLESATKLDNEKKKYFEKAKSLSGGKIDLTQLPDILDKFIKKTGDVATGINELDNSISNLITNKN